MHTFVRFTGFGLSVLPFSPFVAVRWSSDIDVEHATPQGKVFARIFPADGGYKSKLDQHTKSLYEVVEIGVGRPERAWNLETSIFRCGWPDGFEVRSPTSDSDPIQFYLTHENGAAIYVRNGEKAPPVQKMGSPGQILKANGDDYAEYGYTLNSVEWLQRHTRLLLAKLPLIVTLQCPRSSYESALAASKEIAVSMVDNRGMS